MSKKPQQAPDVAVEEAQAAPPPPQPAADQTRISVSRGFGQWLNRMGCSLAFSSYQTGQLFLVGMLPSGQVSFHQQNYVRAMGLHATSQRLYVGSLFQIWRLENVLAPHERANGDFDRLYVPRNAQTIGDIDVHELGVDKAARVIFVNTKYSCLATTSITHGFKPLWKSTAGATGATRAACSSTCATTASSPTSSPCRTARGSRRRASTCSGRRRLAASHKPGIRAGGTRSKAGA